MGSLFDGLFGGKEAEQAPMPDRDDDFASFPDAAEPAPEPLPVTRTGAAGVESSTLTFDAAAPTSSVTWTKWYNIHERNSLSDFRAEGAILVIAAAIFIVHAFGSRANRTKAKAWIRAHAAPLRAEFAHVGFGDVPSPSVSVDSTYPPPPISEAEADVLIKEKSLFEYATYATGRQNVAFMDVNITLTKKFNPLINLAEHTLGYFWDSMVEYPRDKVEIVLYPFDGREAQTVPGLLGAAEVKPKDAKSTYDNFIFAVVNKRGMQKVRDDRFDVSLTITKDHAKLPHWATVMSENAEITETLLTPEFVNAIEKAGDLLDYVVVTDQPADKPKVIEDANPRKRLYLRYHLPSDNDYTSLLPLFEYFLRLPDVLVQTAHFRAEVTRKIKNVRDELVEVIKKMGETEKAEERATEREKSKKAKRDAELKALDAKAQKKYLEKEQQKEMRKSARKIRT